MARAEALRKEYIRLAGARGRKGFQEGAARPWNGTEGKRDFGTE